MVWIIGGILVIEQIATIIISSVILTLLLSAAFMVSPYVGWAAVGVILLFLIKK